MSLVLAAACQTLVDFGSSESSPDASANDAAFNDATVDDRVATEAGSALVVLLSDNFDDPDATARLGWQQSGAGMSILGMPDGGALRARPELDAANATFERSFDAMARAQRIAFEARVRCAQFVGAHTMQAMSLDLNAGFGAVDTYAVGMRCLINDGWTVLAEGTTAWTGPDTIGRSLSTGAWYRVRVELTLQAEWRAGASPGSVRAIVTDETNQQSEEATLPLPAAKTVGEASKWLPRVRIGVVEAVPNAASTEVVVDDVLVTRQAR